MHNMLTELANTTSLTPLRLLSQRYAQLRVWKHNCFNSTDLSNKVICKFISRTEDPMTFGKGVVIR